MKKLFVLLTASLLISTGAMACSNEKVSTREDTEITTEISQPSQEEGRPMGKVAVNISGEIVEVDGKKVKLDDGKWVIITEETSFRDDPDNGVEAVNSVLKIGNRIQGYTMDDPEADTVTAYTIYFNE